MSCRIKIALSVLVLMAASPLAATQQVLEMELPEKKQETVQSRKDVKLPSRGYSQRSRYTPTIGKVAYVDAATCRIFRSRSQTSRVLFTVNKGTPLAVTTTNGSWYGVMMVDGSTGWVPSDNLRLTDLKLVSDYSYSVTPGTASLLEYAMTFLGTPYVWGGNTRSGIDCSGFVREVWRYCGGSLPRTAREQALIGEPVEPVNLQPGDRLYFNCKGGEVDHTGIYIGNGQFIHSSSGKGGVAVEPLAGKYSTWFVGARRG